MNGSASVEPPWMVESTWMPATVPIWPTICCAALATPRSRVSTVLATIVTSDGIDAPIANPDRASPANTKPRVFVALAIAKIPIDATSSTVPVNPVRRSPTRAAR